MMGQAKPERQKAATVRAGQSRRQPARSRSASASDPVIEARPPRKPKVERGHHAVEPEFFPLVSAAHEFKTPLVAILGYTDLLRDARLGPLNQRQRRVLGEIQESAERLQKLIQDLLLLCELKTAKVTGASQGD